MLTNPAETRWRSGANAWKYRLSAVEKKGKSVPMEFLAWIESTQLATWVRESGSIWSYPTVLFFHTVGLAFLVGINVAVDLRVLGISPKLPLGPMQRFFPLMWWGFWVNAISGVLLMIADATTKFTNPVFAFKLTFIAIAVAIIPQLRKRVFPNADDVESAQAPASGKILAAVSLICWVGAIVSGRLTAYIGPVSGLDS
jgi:hypothetical protein